MSSTRIKLALTSLVVLVLMMSGAAFAQTFIGIDYGPFHKDGQGPGTPIPDTQFTNDLTVLAKKFTVIKTYGDDSASRLDQVVPIAKTLGLKVYQGVFEDATYNSAGTTTYLDTAIKLANAYPNTVLAVVVGNECLPTDSNPNPVSATQLAADLQYVRSGLTPGSPVQVTTGFGYQAAISYGPQLEQDVDSVMINIYPFYAGPNGVSISGAFSNLVAGYNMFVGMFTKPVIIGETGWPSAGDDNGSAVPSTANEKIFTDAIFSGASQLGSTFFFEGFNEPWLSVQNSWGPHWGLWNADRDPKFPIKDKTKDK
ncbi:MAG: glycosyl hydrolase family 17 protein [Candidatus Binataceae bacterium]